MQPGVGLSSRLHEISSENVFLNTYTLLIGRSDLTAKSDTLEELNGILKHVYYEMIFIQLPMFKVFRRASC